MKTIKSITKNADKMYAELNQWVSEGRIPLLDLAYPNHDGNQDAEAVAEMMELRDRLNAIMNACKVGIDNLSSAID